MKYMEMKAANRRRFLMSSGLSVLGLGGLALYSPQEVLASTTEQQRISENIPTTGKEALYKLLQGNLRFQQGKTIWPDQTIARRVALSQKQEPFAMIFGCVDSRIPPELVFDQGLGDLFDIRIAGHVLDGAALGSLEFGVAELKIPLLVVLGHERCGAVNATIKAVDAHEEAPGSIQTLVEYIRPSVLDAKGTGEQRLASAIHNNTVRTLQNLLASEILSTAVKAGNLMMVGAHYDLDTAVVSIIC